MEKIVTIHLGKSKMNMDTDVLADSQYKSEVENFIKDFNDDNRTNYRIVRIEGNNYFAENLK